MSLPPMPSPPSVQGDFRDALPPRKQNIACDACRSRKVKCVHPLGALKCDHCTQKRISCTHLIQQQTTEKKRARAAGGKTRTARGSLPPPSRAPQPARSASYTTTASSASPPSHHSTTDSATPSSSSVVIAWLLAPDDDPSTPPPSIANNSWRAHNGQTQSSDGTNFLDLSEVDRVLANEHSRTEFALDLTDTFFQIIHIRIPILNPELFRAKLRSNVPTPQAVPLPYIGQSLSPLPPALLAAVMAAGCKFSDHHIIQMDRRNTNGRCSVGRRLLKRARELAEAEKVYRIPSFDNIVTAIILDCVQTLSLSNHASAEGFPCFWTKAAVDHLFTLGYHKERDISAILDDDLRARTLFAWWFTYLADALSGAFFRRKPLITDLDHTHMSPGDIDPALLGHAEFAIWLHAAHDLAIASRQLATTFFSPRSETEGIPLFDVRQVVSLLQHWRDNHLSRVGVPQQPVVEWDFIKAITSCTSDANYHVMWIIVWQAINDYGIMESNQFLASGSPVFPPQPAESNGLAEELKKEVRFEALHAAQRIAGLVQVLTANGYLRLDPNFLHYDVYTAGLFLAHEAAPEAVHCIAGLRQIGMAYEDALEEADDLSRIFAQVTIEQQRQQQLITQQAHQQQDQNYAFSTNSSPVSPITPAGQSQPTTINLGDDMLFSPQDGQSHQANSYLTYGSGIPLMDGHHSHNGGHQHSHNGGHHHSHNGLTLSLPDTSYQHLMFNGH